MPRTARVAPGGMVFHVLNRGVAHMQVFEKAGDYQAFERVLKETLERTPIRICAYCLMPNPWHLLLWPEHDRELAEFMQRLTITHVSALAGEPALRRAWTCVPRALQIVPRGGRRAFFGGRPLCRAQRAASQLGVACGGVALVESLETLLRRRGGECDLGCVAVGRAEGLAGSRQPCGQREGIGGIAS